MLIQKAWAVYSLIFLGGAFAEKSLTCNLNNERPRRNGFCVPYNSCEDCKPFKHFVNLDQYELIRVNHEACNSISKQLLYCCSHDIKRKVSMDDLKLHPNYNLFDTKSCGVSTVERIAYGVKVGINAYPWHALLNYKQRDGSENFRCGGTLVTDRYVLTAAHCLINQSGEKLYSIRLGELDIETELDCEKTDDEEECAEPVQNILVEESITHEDYTPNSHYANDIALVRLATPARRESNVRPICLPFSETLNTIPPNLIVIGFGKTENSSVSTVMQKAFLPFVNNQECMQIFRLASLKLSFRQFCAGGQTQTDTCSGDSGGGIFASGLLMKGDISRTIQHGIVSFGVRSCGVETVPGIYTKVSEYLEWILDNIKK